MGAALELSLSQIIGDGNNKDIRFCIDVPAGGVAKAPLLVIRLNDDRLVEMTLARGENAMYSCTVGDEKVEVFMGRSLIQVVDGSRKILAEQNYQPVYIKG